MSGVATFENRPSPGPSREREGEQDLALYVHWPFCVSKCPYCDFNSHVRDTVDQDAGVAEAH